MDRRVIAAVLAAVMTVSSVMPAFAAEDLVTDEGYAVEEAAEPEKEQAPEETKEEIIPSEEKEEAVPEQEEQRPEEEKEEILEEASHAEEKAEEASEEEQDLQDEEDEIIVMMDEESYDLEGIAVMSDEEMLAGYVDKVMNVGQEMTGYRKKAFRRLAYSQLGWFNAALYTALNAQIDLVAAGEQSSTTFAVPITSLGLSQTAWTAEELGVSAIVSNGAIASDAKAALQQKLGFNFSTIISALLADDPYSLYWFDKTQSARVTGLSYRAKRNTAGEMTLGISGTMTFYFPVSADYAASTYEVDTSYAESIYTARSNAQHIVENFSLSTDYEKLLGYKDSICQLTSYNYNASGSDYGNPWQLIWVFDGDDTTDVVCEGYAKAFKYLCDMTDFESEDVSCILATGRLVCNGSNGFHMWNVVTAPDGINYIADITNCDQGAIGYSDRLFLVGEDQNTASGSLTGGYTINLGSNYTAKYTYDEDALSIFSADDLEIGTGSFRPDTRTNIFLADIYMEETSLPYNGQQQVPQITITYNGATLTEGVDYYIEAQDNVSVGSKTASIYGMGNFKGVCDISFEITQAELSNMTFTLPQTTYLETGEPICPPVTVTDANGAVLTEGIDYEVAYENNITHGTGFITVTGIGNCTGEELVFFVIQYNHELVRTFDAYVESREGADAQGAVYGLYSDAGCSEELMQLTLDENGSAFMPSLKAGTYYLREIRQVRGYELNRTVYTLTNGANGEVMTVETEEYATSADSLVTENGRTRYIDHSGSHATGLLAIDGYTYLFDDGGYMARSMWGVVDGKTYFFGRDGRAYTGLCTINNKLFFFDEEGVRKLGLIVDGSGTYYLNGSGAVKNEWKTVNGKKYYFGEDGKALTGTAQVDGISYMFDEDGALMSGLVHEEDGIYYINASGAYVKSRWLTIDGSTYFFGNDGRAYTGLCTINNKKFFFDEEGRRKLGLVSWEGDVYFMVSTGFTTNEWRTVSGKKYYFGEDGKALKGLQTLDDGIYYFGDNGVMVKSRWVTIDKKIYFFGSDGKAYTGIRVINLKTFYFSEEGVLISSSSAA